MIVEYKKKSNYSLFVFLVTFLISVAAGFIGLGQILEGNQAFFNNPLFTILGWVSYISLIFGIFYLAKAKGYSGWYALLGLLFLLGLIIMFFLKDKTNPAMKNKSNKLVIIIVVIIVSLGLLGILASTLLEKIDPASKFTDAIISSCTTECSAQGNNSSKCMISCLEKNNIIEPGGKCSSECIDVENSGQCVKECMLPKVTPAN